MFLQSRIRAEIKWSAGVVIYGGEKIVEHAEQTV